MTDEDIRSVLKSLPTSLEEYYTRVIDKIINARTDDVARKVFRWVAMAKRPLSLDELREAIAIEPCQAFRKLDRLVNDISKVSAWCGDLIWVNADDDLVQFAHPTVKQFFLTKPDDSQSTRVHFQLPEIDDEAGEACVTYLNFNDFKRQLIRVSNASRVNQQAITQQVLSLSLGERLTKSIFKLRSGRTPLKQTHQGIVQQLEDVTGIAEVASSQQLHSNFPFLAYANEFWLLHTTTFSENNGTWRLLKNLLSAESPAILPWSNDEWKAMSSNVMQWIAEHDHIGLLQLITP